MKFRKGYFLTFFYGIFFLLFFESQGQIEVRPLLHNGQLALEKQALKRGTALLTLPFVDDFSDNNPYPSYRWTDRYVYINNTYPLYPPTQGVATFDALDENGLVYAHATTDGSSFVADTLTSVYIRLDSVFSPEPKALGVEDSIYFSFFYQPGGGYGNLWEPNLRGNAPLKNDRLTLEFYSHLLKTWIQVWSTEGMTLEEFAPLCNSELPVYQKQLFRPVSIRLNMEMFQDKEFQFRFIAYSSLNPSMKSGGGQWHIDYVYLDRNRSQNEVRVRDVAWVEVSPLILNQYTQVPFLQFQNRFLKDKMDLLPTNLSEEVLSCRYKFNLYRTEEAVPVYSQPTEGEANANIHPFYEKGYYTDPDLTEINFNYDFPDLQQGPRTYKFEHIFKSGIAGDLVETNDTLVYYQTFDNVMAYDDGSAEATVGLTYRDGEMLYPIDIFRADTLTGLQICFLQNAQESNPPFVIEVWEYQNDTTPGRLLYEGNSMDVVESEGMNGFSTYALETPLFLRQGKYFAGIRQLNNHFTNIGLDQNTDAREFFIYSYFDRESNQWKYRKTIYYGTPMIRAVFGQRGVSSMESGEVPMEATVKVSPNPVSERMLQIQLPSDLEQASDIRMRIFDLSGRLMDQGSFRSEYSVENLSPGIYVLQVWSSVSRIHTVKFIKQQ